MNSVFFVLAVIAITFVVVFIVGFARTPPDRVKQLKARFAKLSRHARGRVDAELMERVEALAERFPGQSYVWYLEWLVTDLERAKR